MISEIKRKSLPAIARVTRRRLVSRENQPQVFYHWDGASGELALCVSLADDEFGADSTRGVVYIDFLESDGFVDSAGSKQANAKQGVIAGSSPPLDPRDCLPLCIQ
jgi:hypothetical protein